MVRPQSLCVEDIATSSFLSCTALPGQQPGLSLDATGAVGWRATEGIHYDLCVSGDSRMLLLRRRESVPSVLARGGRSLEVPEAQPVLLASGDELTIADRRIRFHLHGTTSTVSPPTPLVRRPPNITAGSMARLVAASAIMVRCNPPASFIIPPPPCWEVDPGYIDFGRTDLSIPETTTVVITNTCSDKSVSIESWRLEPEDAPFTVNLDKERTIEPGGNLSILVGFDPREPGRYRAFLFLEGTENVESIQLEGQARFQENQKPGDDTGWSGIDPPSE